MAKKSYSAVKRILWIILIANFAVAALKIGVGIASHSQSVMADGFHSVADGASNIVGLIGIFLASKPRDEKHPYGHDKYEILASLFIGLMLAVMAVRIFSTAFESFWRVPVLSIRLADGLLMGITIAVNTVVAITEYRCGIRLGSTILITDSLHTRGDILISCTVLVGLACIAGGVPVWIDAVLSLAVAVAVGVSAWQIIKNCVDVLVDSATVDRGEVQRLLMTIPGIYDVRQVRSRGEPSHTFIDLQVTVSPETNAEVIHGLSHKLEAVLREHFGTQTEVTVHFEPQGNDRT